MILIVLLITISLAHVSCAKEQSSKQKPLETTSQSKGTTLRSEDLNKLIIFGSVLKSSNEYWNSQNSLTKKSNNKPGSKVIVADALGALMFAYSGPMSIIAGGLNSLFVNEALPALQVPNDNTQKKP